MSDASGQHRRGGFVEDFAARIANEFLGDRGAEQFFDRVVAFGALVVAASVVEDVVAGDWCASVFPVAAVDERCREALDATPDASSNAPRELFRVELRQGQGAAGCEDDAFEGATELGLRLPGVDFLPDAFGGQGGLFGDRTDGS
ncbi:hypothetical protein [Amorphus sp. 3PC139-8]|uniref:hypothetical protein n=1 Tax=Amorphus sp. 3PC139-8 TaxID=2735676 RepID=UPI00345CB350